MSHLTYTVESERTLNGRGLWHATTPPVFRGEGEFAYHAYAYGLTRAQAVRRAANRRARRDRALARAAASQEMEDVIR